MDTSWDNIGSSIKHLQALHGSAMNGRLGFGRQQALKQQMMGEVRQLLWQLQDPLHMTMEYCSHANAVGVVTAAMSMDIFDAVPYPGQLALADLARHCKADEALVLRIMHILTSVNIFEEIQVRQWRHNKFSLGLSNHSGPYGSLIWKFVGPDIVPSVMDLDRYHATHGRRDVNSSTENPFSFHHNELGKNYWEIIEKTPGRIDRWNRAMEYFSAYDPLVDLFPFNDILKAGNSSERVLAVDIGGGRGRALQEVKSRCPDLKGRLILQDRTVVVDQIADGELSGIECLAHDFFDIQPVQDAQVYLIKRVLHDWSNEDAAKILKAVVPAMARDSRILVWDSTIAEPVTPAQAMPVWYDSIMMIIGGRERTEADWKLLADMSGLKLQRIWQNPAEFGSFSVVEYMLHDRADGFE